jgi:competence protein ComEA
MTPRLSPFTLWTLIAGMTAMTVFIAYSALKRTAELDSPPSNTVQRLSWPDMRINLNAASPAELCVLPGLGPMLAQRIVDDRDSRGPFASVDDLDRVSGIGPATVERLREFAVADSEPRSDSVSGIGIDDE